jgi:hypothetical protein
VTVPTVTISVPLLFLIVFLAIVGWAAAIDAVGDRPLYSWYWLRVVRRRVRDLWQRWRPAKTAEQLDQGRKRRIAELDESIRFLSEALERELAERERL